MASSSEQYHLGSWIALACGTDLCTHAKARITGLLKILRKHALPAAFDRHVFSDSRQLMPGLWQARRGSFQRAEIAEHGDLTGWAWHPKALTCSSIFEYAPFSCSRTIQYTIQ